MLSRELVDHAAAAREGALHALDPDALAVTIEGFTQRVQSLASEVERGVRNGEEMNLRETLPSIATATTEFYEVALSELADGLARHEEMESHSGHEAGWPHASLLACHAHDLATGLERLQQHRW